MYAWERVKLIDLHIFMESLTRSFEDLNYIPHRANSLSVSNIAITHLYMNVRYFYLLLLPSFVRS